MDLLQLEHFLAVCEERTFTRAAERVFRTQSAVSQSIKKLEEEIGAPLFARDMHEVTLTESGRIVLDYARRMVKLRDEATRRVEALKHMHSGSLTIGSNELAAVYLLPSVLRRYLTEFPDIRIGINRLPPEEIPSRVLNRELDLGFVKEKPAFRDLECLELQTDSLVLVTPPNHPLAQRPSLLISDLGGEPFIVHHGCSGMQQEVLRLFKQSATRCRIVAELWSFQSIKEFVCDGVGIAILPRITVRQEIRSGLLVEIAVKDLNLSRSTYMIYRDQGYLPEAARHLIRIVEQEIGVQPAKPEAMETVHTRARKGASTLVKQHAANGSANPAVVSGRKNSR